MKIALVHGFLGQTRDWDQVVEALHQNIVGLDSKDAAFTNANTLPAFEIQIMDLWKEVSPQEFNTLERAGVRLSQVITGDNLNLVGYSLGGRLLLHWPKDQLWRIKKVILISVHTGLATLDEKIERQLRDEKWVERFLKDEWDTVIEDWNQQLVFSKDLVRPSRAEADFRRQDLALALTNWSLSNQEDLKNIWIDAPFKVDYITGEHDQKFSEHARSLREHGTSWLFHSIPGASHSLQFSHAQEISQILLK